MQKFITFILFFVCCVSNISAEEQINLSKQVIQSFEIVSAKWGQLAQTHVGIGQHLQGLNLKYSEQASDYLEASDAGKALQNSLLDSSFTSVSQVFKFSKRYLGVKYYVEMKESQSGVNLVDMVAILQTNIDRLEKEGASKETINRMQAQLAHHKKRADTIEYMLGLLSDEDKAYVDDNLEWFKHKIQQVKTVD